MSPLSRRASAKASSALNQIKTRGNAPRFLTGLTRSVIQNGDVIFVEKLNAAEGETVKFDVLMLASDDEVKVGTPVVEGANVTGKVLAHGKQAKIMVFKYKSKKNYRRSAGHRQPFTKVEITIG